jgi:16S rRNA (adenine1518-N6/adenine1519-N6)-dimethyltransferase
MSESHRTDGSTGDRPSWRAIMRDLDIRPSKSRGQNFLHDHKIVRRIVDAAQVNSNTRVLEVGPGLGILTSELASRAASVTAIEVDPKLAAHNRNMHGQNVTVVEADVLEVDLTTVLPEPPYVVVTNLPYSIATAVMQRLFETEPSPSRMVVMVQLEVAQRMTARPPDMSILSVAVQFYGRPKILFRIGRGAFIPQPRVDSAVVAIEMNEELPLGRSEHSKFFRLVRAGFAQRRKRLDNSISSALDLPKGRIAAALVEAEIDPATRAERLDITDWVSLFTVMRGAFDD